MSRAAKINALRERIRRIEGSARHGVLPFGVAAIDHALPDGGLALGAVHEILGIGGDEEDGAAAAGFAAGILARLGAGPSPASPQPSPPTLPSPASEGGLGRGSSPPRRDLREAEREKSAAAFPLRPTGPVLWCLKKPDLYGPGLLAHGLDPARLVLVAARHDDEVLWAVEEGLRTPGLAAVVGETGRLPMVAGRRLQLAAERSGVTALLLRRWHNAAEAAAERERPSAALTRWRIGARPSADIGHEAGIGQPFPHPNPPPLAGEGMGGGGARHGRGLWLGRPRWRVELLRVRGGVPAIWDVEVADATGHVSLSAKLADRPAAPHRLGAEPVRRRAG